MKTNFLVTLIFVITQLVSCSTSPDSVCPDSNCDNYATQEEAQSAYEADPTCRKDLDADKDGKACEHLKSSGSTNCPSTANCGCSGKNKSQCGGPCCQWIVGSGCKCS